MAGPVECYVCSHLVSMRAERSGDRVSSNEGWAHAKCVDETLMSPEELLLKKLYQPDTSTGCAYCGLPVPLRERRATEAGWAHEGCTGRSLRSPGGSIPKSEEQPGERIVHAVMSDGSELVRYESAGWWREWPTATRPAERLTIGAAVHLAVQDDAELRPGQPGGQAFMRRIRRGE